MNKFSSGLIVFLKAIASLFYSFKDKKIKLSSIALNSISVSLTFILIKGFNFIMRTSKTPNEFALSSVIFLGSILPIYVTMLYSIHKGLSAKQTKEMLVSTIKASASSHTSPGKLITPISNLIGSGSTKDKAKVLPQKIAQVLK